MWRFYRDTLVSFGVVLICLASLGVLVYSYDHVAPQPPTQNQAQETPKQDQPKPVEAKQAQPAAPMPPRRGFRMFSKKARMTTLSERLGVRLETPGVDLMLQLGLPEGEGLLIGEVRDDTAAANVGMKTGDVLIELGGRNVPSDPGTFDFQLSDLKAAEPLNAVILRDGKAEVLKGLILSEPTARTFIFPSKKKAAPVDP